MKNAEAVAKAHSEFTAQETDMKKQAADKPVESVDGSTLPEGTKEIGDKPEEAVEGTTLPGGAAPGSAPETSAEGDKPNKTPNLTVAPEEAVKGTTLPADHISNTEKSEEAVDGTTFPSGTKDEESVKKSAATEMPMPEDKDVMAPAIDDVKVDEKPLDLPVDGPKVDAPVEPVSAFDTAEKLDIGEGYSAHKDKESKEVIIEKDGKEVKRLPDGFGAEVAVVLPLLKAVLGLPAEEAKPEVPGMAAPVEEKKEEVPAVEEHPALEEAHEDELGIKESALKVKEAELIAKEAEIKAKEDAARKVEASKKFAAVLQARAERCKKIVAALVAKDAIKMDQATYDSERQIGTYLLDAQHKAFEHAISAKQKELLAMNDESLLAMEKVVADLKAPVVKKASHIFVSPSYGEELSEDQEIARIFKTMGTGKHPQ